MKPIEIKIKLLKKGLTVAEIARTLETESTAKKPVLASMIEQMINGRRFYPSIAEEINAQFDLGLECPEYLKPLPSRRAA